LHVPRISAHHPGAACKDHAATALVLGGAEDVEDAFDVAVEQGVVEFRRWVRIRGQMNNGIDLLANELTRGEIGDIHLDRLVIRRISPLYCCLGSDRSAIGETKVIEIPHGADKSLSDHTPCASHQDVSARREFGRLHHACPSYGRIQHGSTPEGSVARCHALRVRCP